GLLIRRSLVRAQVGEPNLKALNISSGLFAVCLPKSKAKYGIITGFQRRIAVAEIRASASSGRCPDFLQCRGALPDDSAKPYCSDGLAPSFGEIL
ncbi:MAG: hypothetical protein Q4D82_02165, partial [Neisseria sp.]|nr:hypothetical protein [Neisseria sp.]